MTDLKILSLIEREIEKEKEQVELTKQWGVGNKLQLEHLSKLDMLYYLQDKINEEISKELNEQYEGCENEKITI